MEELTIEEAIKRIRAGRGAELVPEGKPETQIYDLQIPGLYIRVLESGVGTWTLRYKRLGQQKKKALGNVLVCTRAQAHKRAIDLLAMVDRYGHDPVAARQAQMAANKETFASLVPLFIAQCKENGNRPSTIEGRERYLTGYYVEPLHNRPVADITKKEIQPLIDKIKNQAAKRAGRLCDRPGARTAVSVCNTLHAFFEWMLRSPS